MTSYVYNPSQKVTELLSRYLEFDANQLEVGIWSGHLRLKDVHLKASAVDQFLKLPSSSFHLVSGTIGLLDLRIPWKQLVWGQSDVHVQLRDVVLVLRVKPQEEAFHSQDDKNQQDQYHHSESSREMKQKRLREAERRALQGRPLGPWLRTVKKRDDEESAKNQAIEPAMLEQETWISKRLKSTVNHFFWRFFAGLQMELTNLKIVLVQDGVEVGVSVPSFTVNGKEEHPPRHRKSQSLALNKSATMVQTEMNAQHHQEYQGEFEDGEHVDKHIRVSQFGIFIRKEAPYEDSGMRVDVMTKEYILCPMDLDFAFSLFYPHPPEKRQKRKAPQNEESHHASEDTRKSHSISSVSRKKRRGKRDKIDPHSISTAELTMTDHDHVSTQRQSLQVEKTHPHRRRASISCKPNSVSRHVTVTLPLAQPQELKTNLTHRQTGEHARLEGHLKVGLVNLRFSTRHYQLFGKLIVDAARIRNGRPDQTIRSAIFLREQQEDDDQSVDVEETKYVVRSWWTYAITAVLREVQKRRKLRQTFQDRFLSFKWDRQKYKRSDYIRLYIDHRLRQHLLAPDEEDLLCIEDELCIEQILLYRAIARKIHVYGGTEMPRSLLDLVPHDKALPTDTRDPNASNMSTSSAGDHRSARYDAGPLGSLEEQCEIARLRRDSNDFPPGPQSNQVFSGWDSSEMERDAEEMSFVTTKTSTTDTVVESNKMLGEKSQFLFLTFSMQVDCVELAIIKEELFPGAEFPSSRRGGLSNSSVSSKFISDLSVLTEDDQWDSTSQHSQKEQNPLDPSDYLIFGVPEKVLLRLSLQQVDFSAVTGDSGRINFSVALIETFGDQDKALFTVGMETASNQPQQQALSFWVDAPKNGDAATVQVDAATVRFWAYLESFRQLEEFFVQGGSLLPVPLLKRSAREEVRLYVLKESSQSAWSRVHASIRINGAEVVFGQCTLRFDMLELYSGSSIPKNCTDDTNPIELLTEEADGTFKNELHTRTLRMIQADDLAKPCSPWSQRWVFALSGMDFSAFRQDGKLFKFLEMPVDLEALFTFNSNTFFDVNQAKVKALMMISPVHLLLSEERQVLLRSSLPVPPSTPPVYNLPPRLEVLSRFVLLAAEVSVQRFRVAILRDEECDIKVASSSTIMRECLEHFLEQVSCFDLSFPHEEALSSAMQICIDRLAGAGMPLDGAWQAANASLLHFLEQMTKIPEDDLDQSLSNPCIDEAIRQAANLTTDDHAVLIETGRGMNLRPQDFVLEFVDGFKITTVQLFHDSYLQIIVPCVFCANGEGVHVLRLTPTSTALNNENPSLTSSSDHVAGLFFRRFLVDKDHPFGRGGLPLTVLGSDKNEAHDDEHRVREQLDSCQIGEVELFSTRKILEEFSTLLSTITSPFLGKGSGSEDVAGIEKSPQTKSCHLSMTVMSASLLVASDELVPFSRLFLSRLILCIGENINLRSECLNIFNLSPESESYPIIVSALDNEDDFNTKCHPPFTLEISGSNAQVTICGMQIVFLQKYVDEVRQILFSPKCGILPLFQDDSGADTMTPSSLPSLLFRIELRKSSLLLPRSSTSSDMIAIESESIVIIMSDTKSSFSMPDGLIELQLEPLEAGGESSRVLRTKIELREARMFSSLSEVRNVDSADHPSFHYFYKRGGRAAPDKNVYVNRSVPENSTLPQQIIEENLFKAQRTWREISVEPISLDVLVDQAPHLRILLTNPGDELGAFLLNIRVSQFCLLLSVWYSNMQELPCMFPYDNSHVKSVAELPVKAQDFPELGTEEMRKLLLNPLRLTSEFCLVYEKLSVRFTFDCYDSDDRLVGESAGSTLCLEKNVLHFTKDEMGVGRCGIASNAVLLQDENCSPCDFLIVPCDDNSNPWADMQFGLNEDYRSLAQDLMQPFQVSLFITPSWSMFNVGLDSAKLVLSDFNPIFRLLEFVSAYATDEHHGNPSFAAAKVTGELKQSLREMVGVPDDLPPKPVVCGGTDFRLWLTSPIVSIPCIPSGFVNVQGDGGFWFHYTSSENFSSQEFVTGGLSIKFREGRHREQKLVEDLTFGIRIDNNCESNHSDYSIQIPFADAMACSVVSPRITVSPITVAEPSVCKPSDQPSRHLGSRVCEMTCIFEVLPTVTSALLGLFTPKQEAMPKDNFETEASTYSLVAGIGDLRLFLLDPILGSHLPVLVVSLSSIKVTLSQFSNSQSVPGNRRSNESAPDDMNAIVECHLWADYFKLGSTRSWEPLLEAYKFSLLWERSKFRGGGMTLLSDCPFHVNVSGAFLVIFNQVFGLYKQQFLEKRGSAASPPMHRTVTSQEPIAEPSYKLFDAVEGLPLIHRKPMSADISGRVAFSLKNMTGQRIRLYRYESLSEGSALSYTLTYLDHCHVVKLSFEASVSSIQNLAVREVKYPGFNEVNREVVPHAVDIQLSGCHWIRGIKVDSFGRNFAAIEPKSVALQRRLEEDWRLRNLMKVLIEIGFEKGGRQVAVRSLFEVVNKTAHSIRVICHPDPNFSSQFEQASGKVITNGSDVVEPGDVFNVPTLLILDAMNHDNESTGRIGSFWIKPEQLPNDVAESFVGMDSHEKSADSFDVYFSSRGVHLSKIVEESAYIFQKARGEDVSPDQAKTAVQLSCPLVQAGDRLAPFCYAVEVGRSPIVKAIASEMKECKARVHGPILYTLSVHPPFVFVNLLPRKGRFELMHAVHRKVLWFRDVEPGEEVSVHSVGLDSPLLLLINLGYCRTPIGEGALVHHGADHNSGLRENLGGFKSIGKAGKAVTKQIGKTLTAIGESPDKRAHNKIFKAQNPNLVKNTSSKHKKVFIGTVNDTNEGSTGVADGKMYRVDSSFFSPQDVTDETTVVDSLGQKLTLNIENIRGGGGQRRISVYCPFWIVNTTEHPLRYKQENSKMFISGTVHSPDRDGSKSMVSLRHDQKEQMGADKQNGVYKNRNGEKKAMFSGTPGALASRAGVCRLPTDDIAQLLDTNLPIDRLGELAFMFNFHDALGMGAQRLCIQLGDGTGTLPHQSDWSRGLSLDSVGISQIANMHCKDGRFLDLTVLVYLAPGILSTYTTIVRILPRYVVVNMLSYPVRLWQDNSIFRPHSSQDTNETEGEIKWTMKQQGPTEKINQYENLWGRAATLDDDLKGKMPLFTTASQSATYIKTIDSSQLAPFALPDSRSDRLLRFDFGGSYKLTASVSMDAAGEHVLPLTRNVDLKMLRHVSTRASPEYQVSLISGVPGFTGELGVWFETEWGNSRRVVVKGIKKPSFAFNETDIHIGDELLKIDGIPVLRQTFEEVMGRLRVRLNEVSQCQDTGRSVLRRASMRLGGAMAARETQDARPRCRPLELVFRTVEERLRRVRMKATKANATTRISAVSLPSSVDTVEDEHTTFVRAELKTIHHMMFVVLRSETNPPFSIRNQTFATTIYFRQKGCTVHSWLSLKPGETCNYAWQEPLKPKRLSVRVASETTFRFDEVASGQSKKAGERKIIRQHNIVQDEEDAFFSQTISVRLEEIGSRELLQWQEKRTSVSRWLEFEVDVIGTTRVLIARDISQESNRYSRWQNHLDSLQEAIQDESNRSVSLVELNDDIVSRATSDNSSGHHDQSSYALAEEASGLMSDLSETPLITSRHQVLVEILESTGLSSDSIVGDCNPYVEVKMKHGKSSRRSFFKKPDIRRTYYVRQSFNPTWECQAFLFEVSPEAVDNPRGHAVNILVKNYRRFGHHNLLGKAQVDLHSLRDQEPLVGWFPLAGRTGRRELESQLSHWGRGSIRLRVQWIYSIPGLMQYYILLSQNRLKDLQTRKDGLLEQLRQNRAAEEKKMNARDGFKSIRVPDLLSMSKANFTGPSEVIAQRSKGVVKKLMRPLRPLRSGLHSGPSLKMKRELQIEQTEEREINQTLSPRAQNPANSEFKLIRIGTSSMPLLTHNLEDKINLQRKQFQSHHLREREDRNVLSRRDREGTKVEVSLIRSWTVAQQLFNNDELSFRFDDSKLSAFLNPILSPRTSKLADAHPISEKLGSGLNLPSKMLSFIQKQATAFRKSRNSFEQAAKRSFSAVLNEGGFLTIRPIRALNLPDTYTGMFVKVRCGQNVIVTQTVDARVAPVWSQCSTEFKPLQSSTRCVAKQPATNDTNDIRIRVSPQESSGWVRLSVMGEKRQQQLQAKTEIGVIYLPLGKLLAACLGGSNDSSGETAVYERWFPLLSQEEAAPVEGAGGLIPQPPEAEQIDETNFKDIYRPCIQLAVSWSSDKERERPLGRGRRRTMHTVASAVNSYLKADISRLSAALIDSERSFELLSFNVLDIDAKYWVTSAKTRLALSVYWVQIDNQAESAREAIALAPTPNDFSLPVFQVFAMKDNQRSVEVVSFDFIDVSVAEFDVTIEEQLICDLYIFFYSLKLRNAWRPAIGPEVDGPNNGLGVGGNIEEPDLCWLLENGFNLSQESQRVYVEQLFLGVIKFNLSYVKGRRNAWDLSRRPAEFLYKQLEEAVQRFSHHSASDMLATWSRKTSNEDKFEEDKGLQNLPKLLASLFPNVSDAPVRLQGKALNHVFESPSEILNSIRRFYVNETMKQIYKIIGALDFVGNPTMLVSSVVTGFKDLLLAPSTAFLKSPTDPSVVGMGVAKGTLSLFSHSTSGFFAFCTKVSATAAQFVANLSFDAEYSNWHREKIVVEATNIQRQWKRRGAQSIGYMVARPVADIFLGIIGGSFGLFLAPVKGLRKGGTPGLVSGIAVGVTGVVVRPIVGVLDAMAHFSAAIHDIAKSVNILEKRFQPALRVRLAYTFGFMNILMPFESSLARADALIKRYPLRQRKRSSLTTKEVVVHVEVLPNSTGDATYAILTNVRVILVRMKKGTSGDLVPLLCWEFHLNEKTNISSEVLDHGHSGVALTIRLKKSKPNEADVGDSTAPWSKRISTPELIKFQSRIIRKRPQPLSFEDTTVARAEAEDALNDGAEGREENDEKDENESEEELSVADTANDFDHYTKTNTEGELLECFSILAEYQFRRQLGRLHNALCCIIGNFDAVMKDGDLGPRGSKSQDGYTSFGIYRFSRDTLSVDTGEHRLPRALENLPWVTDNLFETASHLTPSEQQEAVSRERQSMNHASRLRASAKEGGLEWLINARAWAMSLEKEDGEEIGLQSSSCSKGSEKAETSQSDDSQELNDNIFSSARTTYDSISDSEDTAAFESPRSTGLLKGHSSRDSESGVVCERSPGFKLGHFEKPISDARVDSSTKMDQSFASSFVTANNEMQYPNMPESLSSRGRYEEQMTGEASDPEATESEETAIDISNLQDTLPKRIRRKSDAASNSSDRMNRMESLMEQLITLSAEQTLTRERILPVSQTGPSEFSLLRQEIGELKDELRKKSASDAASEEVAKLREEVAWLKDRLEQKDQGKPQRKRRKFSFSFRGKGQHDH